MTAWRVRAWIADLSTWQPTRRAESPGPCQACAWTPFYYAIRWQAGVPHHVIHPLVSGMARDLAAVLAPPPPEPTLDFEPCEPPEYEDGDDEFDFGLQEPGISELTDLMVRDFTQFEPRIIEALATIVIPRIEKFVADHTADLDEEFRSF